MMEIERSVTGLSHNCTECKQPLPLYRDGRTPKRVTCSPKCRKRRERRMKDQHSAYILALHELQKMRDGIKRREQLADFREQLNRLKGEINDLLLLAGDGDALARRQMLEDRMRRKV